MLPEVRFYFWRYVDANHLDGSNGFLTGISLILNPNVLSLCSGERWVKSKRKTTLETGQLQLVIGVHSFRTAITLYHRLSKFKSRFLFLKNLKGKGYILFASNMEPCYTLQVRGRIYLQVVEEKIDESYGVMRT